MVQGKVKWFSEQKGFGFIEQESGEDVFVHYRAITGDGFKTPGDGDEIEFEVQHSPGGMQAVNVHKMREPLNGKPRNERRDFTFHPYFFSL